MTAARRILGLDLSITAPGLVHTGNQPDLGALSGCPHTVKTRQLDGDRRLTVIKLAVANHAAGTAGAGERAEFALIEDLPVHGKAAGITGMVHGVVRDKLLELGIAYGTVPPATLKKYATGVGTASKTQMAVAALKRAPGVEFADDNQCDAWWLWVMAHDYLGAPLFPMPALNRGSLEKIKKAGTE